MNFLIVLWFYPKPHHFLLEWYLINDKTSDTGPQFQLVFEPLAWYWILKTNIKSVCYKIRYELQLIFYSYFEQYKTNTITWTTRHENSTHVRIIWVIPTYSPFTHSSYSSHSVWRYRILQIPFTSCRWINHITFSCNH